MGLKHSRASGEARFEQGLRELDRYLFHLEDAALPHAIQSFRAATELTPQHLESWVALGFALDAAGIPDEAATALRCARKIAPDDQEIEVFVTTLLSESGPESEALESVRALAERRGVDLESLRSNLNAADMPTDSRTVLLNGFLSARSFVRSRLEDLIARQARCTEATLQAAADEDECDALQEDLRASLDVDCLPGQFRELTPWVIRLGIGDDVCRGLLMEDLTRAERAELHRLIQLHAPRVHDWLDKFDDESMTPEAAAFMYLLLGVEEMGASES